MIPAFTGEASGGIMITEQRNGGVTSSGADASPFTSPFASFRFLIRILPAPRTKPACVNVKIPASVKPEPHKHSSMRSRHLFLAAVFLFLLSNARSQAPASVFVHFAFDKYELSATTRATLDSLTEVLDTTDRIELHGHCDAKGSNAYNDRLSARRVEAVKKYLFSLGWEERDILVSAAHGENIPLVSNNSDEQRSLNRRVEIRIIPGKVSNTKTLSQKLADSTLKAGSNIVLPDILFIGGTHRFLPESNKTLADLLDAMLQYPNLVIRVEGHICCEESSGDGLDIDTRQQNLSAARARAVMDFLLENNIAPERVSYFGFGHSKPIYPYPEQSEEERKLNRRVEIRIIRK